MTGQSKHHLILLDDLPFRRFSETVPQALGATWLFEAPREGSAARQRACE
jgi:hypothetical protein